MNEDHTNTPNPNQQHGKHAAKDAAPSANAGNSKKKPQVIALSIVFAVLVALTLAGVGYLVWQGLATQKAADEGSGPAPSAPAAEEDSHVANPIDFANLRLENPDIYAWIYIPDTNVNYPVLQNPTDDSYYLKHDKDGNYSEAGAIYSQLANKTDFSDPVTVLYGHNMNSGGMFATLHYFENKEFFDSHEDMYIYADGHIYTYRVVSAYQYDNRHILNSFNFTDPAVVQQYFNTVLNPDSLVKNVREGVQLSADSDKIVQLSTCTGDANHLVRRYLVTGVLVNDQQTY